MKKLLSIAILGLVSLSAFSNPKTIYGRECSINTYDSYEEASNIGKFGIDSHDAFTTLVNTLKTNDFHYYSEPMAMYNFKDFEFLIEVKLNSGRGSDNHLSLEIMNTGKYGNYSRIFYLEAANTGDPAAVAKTLIRQIPRCVKK